MAVSKRDVSVDADTLLNATIKAVEKGWSQQQLADDLFMSLATLRQRLSAMRRFIRESLPEEQAELICEQLEFPKGKKGGTGVSVTKPSLAGLQLLIAAATGADEKTVVENGMSLVRKEEHGEVVA